MGTSLATFRHLHGPPRRSQATKGQQSSTEVPTATEGIKIPESLCTYSGNSAEWTLSLSTTVLPLAYLNRFSECYESQTLELCPPITRGLRCLTLSSLNRLMHVEIKPQADSSKQGASSSCSRHSGHFSSRSAVRARMYVPVCTSMHVCMYVCMYACMYVCR